MFYFIPFIAAFIGWLIHRIAIYFLFRPYAPLNIPGMRIQGILPRYKKNIATSLGNAIQQSIPFDSISERLTNEATIKNMMPQIDGHIDYFLRNKLKEKIPMLAMFIGDSTIASIKDTLMGEIEVLLPTVIKSYITGLKEDINVAQLANDELDKISETTLDTVLRKAFKMPLYILSWLGAVNGFVVGIIVCAIMYQW